jgi:Holliday junction DNA helicase RuvA
MIVTLEGTLSELQPLQAVITVCGVGYEVHIPLSASECFPPLGEKVKLHIHSIYREDAHALYGFLTTQERDFFKLIVEKVSGVGPKIALSLLSKYSLKTLLDAIRFGNVSLLKECPGIGAKTAERITLELKDKVGGLQTHSTIALNLPLGSSGLSTSHLQEAIAALVTLGYKPTEAEKAVSKVLQATPPGEPSHVENIIKRVLEKKF